MWTALIMCKFRNEVYVIRGTSISISLPFSEKSTLFSRAIIVTQRYLYKAINIYNLSDYTHELLCKRLCVILEHNIFTVTTQFSLYNFLTAFIHNGENNHFSEIHYKYKMKKKQENYIIYNRILDLIYVAAATMEIHSIHKTHTLYIELYIDLCN